MENDLLSKEKEPGKDRNDDNDKPVLRILNDYFTEQEFSDGGRYFEACMSSGMIYDWNRYKRYEEKETLSNLTDEEYDKYLNESIAKGNKYFIILAAFHAGYKDHEFIDRLISSQPDPLNLKPDIENILLEDSLFSCSWHTGKYSENLYAAYYKIKKKWQGPIIKPRIPLHPFVIKNSPIFISEGEFKIKARTFGLTDEQIDKIINAKRKTNEMH